VIHPHPSDRIVARAAFTRGLLLGLVLGTCAALLMGFY
jgi:hypothetical protein